jgi:uncharacterized membrane protein
MDIKSIVFWVLLLLFVTPGFIFGYLKLVASESKMIHFQRLGIGKTWMQILGLAEILSDIALLIPITRPIGMASWLVILLGANFFNITKKEPKEELYASIGVLGLLVVIWMMS